uniref:Cilia- and flagella- associated protein 210 isoform X2 n=1 Tax=Pogona vitticeps TaxID=103695 RepID=A0ABM5EX52_9SAUR
MPSSQARPVGRMGRRREPPRLRRRRREAPPNNEDEVEGLFLPVGVDLQQITILPKAEWQRIQDSLTATAREAARIRAERKAQKDLHLKSQALVKNWTNTIARALLLTEVLKERDAQIEFKKNSKHLYRKKEEEIEREHQKAIQIEEEKAKERHMKRLQLSKDQLEQIKEHEHLAELSRLEEKKERENIQALAKLHQMEMLKKEQEEYEQKFKRKREHQAHVADQVILRAIEKQKQEEEDDKIRAHYKAKQAMIKLRKAKEEEMLRLMEEQRENISNRLLKYMKKKVDDEDERIAREVAETEEELEKERKAKEEKNKADLESIRDHRIGVIKMKEEKEKERKLEAQQILRGQLEADRIYQEMEKDKKHRNHCANLKLQEVHVMQIAEKFERQKREKQEDLEYARQKEHIALWKEQEFQEYAKKVIDDTSKTTRNLYPLIRAANEGSLGSTGLVQRERLQSCDKHDTKLPYIGDTAQEMKLLNEHGYNHTKARLGFTW